MRAFRSIVRAPIRHLHVDPRPLIDAINERQSDEGVTPTLLECPELHIPETG